MANQQLDLGKIRVFERVEALINGLPFLGIAAPDELLEAAAMLARDKFEEAAQAHRVFLGNATRLQDRHADGPKIVAFAAETQAYLGVLAEWASEPDPSPEYGHSPDVIAKVVNANKWNAYEMVEGHTEIGLEFYNDWWTGIHHSKSSGLMRDFRMQDCYIHDNKKWSSRANRIQEDVTFQSCTFQHNRDEHFIYHNTAGFGPGVTQAEADKRVCEGIYNCLFDDCDSQGLQFVSADGREDETPDPEFDDTPGGRIEVLNTKFTRTGQGVFNGNTSSRPSFTLSFFPGKHQVTLYDVIVDNSMLPKSTGGLLVQRHPSLLVDSLSLDFPSGDRSLAKIEETPLVRIKGGRWWGSRPVNINKCGDVKIEGVESNVDLYVDGKRIGRLSDGYSSL